MIEPNINFITLRELAETAAGLRNNKDLYFIVSGNPVTFRWQADPPPYPPEPGTLVIHCQPLPAYVPPVHFAKIGEDEQHAVDLLNIKVEERPPYPAGTFAADAVFWSVSAVEKFLVPYYAATYGDDGPRYAQMVLDALLYPAPNVTPLAVAHLPSTEYVPIEAPDEAVPHVAVIATTKPPKDVQNGQDVPLGQEEQGEEEKKLLTLRVFRRVDRTDKGVPE